MSNSKLEQTCIDCGKSVIYNKATIHIIVMTTKVSIVTGAGQGIGKALAGVLLEEGYKVNGFYSANLMNKFFIAIKEDKTIVISFLKAQYF